MIKTQKENKRYEDELILFYNKYLFLELGEGYLPALVDKFTKLWKKENQLITSTEKNFKLTLEDYLSLSKLDQDFLTFVHHPVINVNDDYQLITDEYGLIKGFLWKRDISDIEVQELEQNIGSNIFAFLEKFKSNLEQKTAFENAENIILQNILVSKIYKAVYENLTLENKELASIFVKANIEIFSYDDKLKEIMDYEELFKLKLANTRSRR